MTLQKKQETKNDSFGMRVCVINAEKQVGSRSL